MIALTGEPLELAALVAAVSDPEHGAVVTFTGAIRHEGDERPVVALEYEAYAELALAELAAIADEAQAAWGARLALVHRTGRVEVGQASVAVAAAASHRPAAFSACRYAIDELKRRAPIWKRTLYADGEAVWRDREALAPSPSPAAIG